MKDYCHLLHPFQQDPGVSQRQRIMEDLVSGSARIDGRSLADLLDYFVQLAQHINYYHADLSVSDWQPFFRKSTPFVLAAMTKYDQEATREKIAFYRQLFDKQPSEAGLQLLIHYLFYGVIDKVNTWHQQVKDSELPVAFTLEKLIKDRLQQPVRKFIGHANAAVQGYCIKPLDVYRLYDNAVWGFDITDLYSIDARFKSKAATRRERLIFLRDSVLALLLPFLEVIQMAATTAELSMEQSLLPLKAELQERHSPHLAILFAFLKLFRYLQDDLNGFTKKHLNFFYQQVLHLKTQEATPDKAHLVFEVQHQLNKYLLKEGLLVKDGKDNNKAEVLFALDDEIVVNKAQVADQRTLFLNHQTHSTTTYLEGVYIAPNAGKADGVEEDFQEDTPKSFPTLGAKYSKYIDTEHQFIQPYPHARLGFVLASPVLLLQEGTRTVTITLACMLQDDYCQVLTDLPSDPDPCCEGREQEGGGDEKKKTVRFEAACKLYEKVQKALEIRYYYVSQPLIQEAIKQGIGPALVGKLKELLIRRTSQEDGDSCYCPVEEILYDRTLTQAEFEGITTPKERALLAEIIPPRRAIRLLFSGEKEWILPSEVTSLTLTPETLPCDTEEGPYPFTLAITAILKPDQPAVTFYDPEQLKEDLNTSLPVVKIELDDTIKLACPPPEQDQKCCLDRPWEDGLISVSLYHFFRNVVVIDKIGNDPDQKDDETGIAVTVCELKNMVVQNDESIQNVNSPIYPFGTRPAIADFDVVNPADPPLVNPNLIGPNFYLGSHEVFCKKWGNVRININWKDKPSDFREYYKAYVVEDVTAQIFGLDEDKFAIRVSVLQDKNWSAEAADRKLFDENPPIALPPVFPGGGELCDYGDQYEQSIVLSADDFPNQEFCISPDEFTSLDVNTRNGFIKINLRNQDFLHKDYAFVLARQMMALGRYPDAILEGAVYKKDGNTVIVFRSLGKTIVELKDEIFDTKDAADLAKNKVDDLNTTFDAAVDFPPPLSPVTDAERDTLIPLVHDSKTLTDDVQQKAVDTKDKLLELQSIIDIFDVLSGEIVKPLTVLIPNEPWTPIIKEIAIDYTATATAQDIDLIHLYPYEGTYKHETITQQPTLLPTFCDEGTLFLGLKDLVPGSNLNLLFQLAEATADSEADPEDVRWHYLDNNQWKALRPGFEVLDDATGGLTTSGIIKLAVPANMTSDNTILPKGLHWIKVAIPQNSRSVSETIGIHAQAIRATFTNQAANDRQRLRQALPAGSLAKLQVADALVKKVSQPYDSFGGRVPEAAGHYYVRVSEHLRHKGRAIQKFDYERLALEAFPQLFKVKCINHSFALNAHRYVNDFPVAPGYVLLAVIPDLNQLKASASFEPRAPVSLLEAIQEYLRKRTSPFVRLRVMNPRYERVHFCLKVQLYPGKDVAYYQEKLRQEVREFLAPWAIGQYDKLTFGQCLYRSDVLRFLETRDYLDYLLDLRMKHEDDEEDIRDQARVCPLTPRSILIAGSIEVCIPQQDCEGWEEDGEDCRYEAIPLAEYCPKDTIR